MATMYYSSESSDSDNLNDTKSLDLSYLMIDTDSVASYLRNSVREQHPSGKMRQLGMRQEGYSSNSDVYKIDETVTSPTVSGAIKNDHKLTVLQEETCQDENDKLELKMESLSTEAVGQIFNNSEKYTDASAYPSSHSKSQQIKSLQETITRSRNASESEEIISIEKDDITEKLFLNHNLIINVPFELALYHKLKFLDISNNNIDHLNDFILELPELQTLYVKNNQLDNEGIPKDISALTKLRELNIAGNLLTVVPPQLFGLTNLRYLYLGNNNIAEVMPEIKVLQNLQVLHLGGNSLTQVPDELGELSSLCALVLCNNSLRKLPRAISRLTKLRSLMLHANNLCCLPVEIVKLQGLSELSLRDNPLVTRFVNTCARELMFNPPSLKELAARTVQQQKVSYTAQDLPQCLLGYLTSGHKCVNPKCKGVYFTSCVEHIKFVDFCGMYRVPLMHYLCSSRCTSRTPRYYRRQSSSPQSDSDDEVTVKKVLLG